MRAMVGDNPIRAFLSEEYWTRYYDWWGYPVNFEPLAAGQLRAREEFTADSDSDFLCLSVGVVVTDAADPTTEVTFPPILVSVNDSGSGSEWTQIQTHLSMFAGRSAVDGAGPMVLEVPRLVRSKSTTIVELDNEDAANPFTVRMLFRGAKLYTSMMGKGSPPPQY